MDKYNVLKSIRKYFKKNNLNLHEFLEEITVMEVSEIPKPNIENWYAVADTDGINAFFSTETEAYAYRLFLVNRVING